MALSFPCFGVDKGPISVEELASRLRHSYQQKNAADFLNNYYVEGTPKDLLSGITNSIAANWGQGKWVVESVRVIPFSEYKPTTAVPGEINGKKLKWLIPPSHWIILAAKMPKDDPLQGGIKIELAAVRHNDRWWVIGVR